MNAMLQKAIMLSVMTVVSAGGYAAYETFADEQDIMTIEQLSELVSWDMIASVVTMALGRH